MDVDFDFFNLKTIFTLHFGFDVECQMEFVKHAHCCIFGNKL